MRIDIEAITTLVISYVPQVIGAFLIALTFTVIYRITKKPIRAIGQRMHLETPVNDLLLRVYKWTIFLIGALMTVGQLGIDVGAALAGLGVAGIAIGFAAQDTLSNIIAGFIIFFDKPFKVGDWIEIEEHYGKVWEITMRSTRIRTLNHTYVVIPNKNIIDQVLNNHSKYGKIRVEVPLGIAYKESVHQAREVILRSLEEIDLIVHDPKPTVVVEALGDSSVNLIVRVWINDGEHEKPVFYATMEKCKLALDEAGIEIPFPHLQLFVDDVKQKAIDQLQALQIK